MRLHLPNSLHYPITVTELLLRPGDHVDRLAPLFSYSYTTTVTEGDPFGETNEVQKTLPASYESPVEGELKAWRIEPGAVITQNSREIAEIEEPCPHSVQFGGMCTLCGKDMTEISYNTDLSDADRATINMIHDNNALTVSQDEASRAEEEAKRRLLKSKKLSLVVDLDQTIIHATVDPTVAEWQQDPENPNYDAVKHVRAFQLIDDGPGGRGCWYYIKLRPHLKEFLDNISKLYELHIYTMGTRAYAQNIAYIVDPDRRIFGDRILSRDESGSLTAKNLQRLFPVDTKMVVIIDDRGDVWKWSDNLVKVTPYDFFVGIGDINSSFLPKKAEMQTSPKELGSDSTSPTEADVGDAVMQAVAPGASVAIPSDPPASQTSSDSGKSDVSALEQLVSMGGGDDPDVLQHQASEQVEAIAAQVQDRPLLQQQKALDAEDEAAAASAETSPAESGATQTNGDEPMEDVSRHRHNLLRDDDNELTYLEQSLTEVHRTFFEEYENKIAIAPGPRIAALRGEKGAKKQPRPVEEADLEAVPDIKNIMPKMKLRVLEGVNLVLSGVVPLGQDIHRSDIALWAKSFGAQIFDNVSRHTTHVVAARNRTAKVRQAARVERIKIVETRWLLDSISQWQRLTEEPYLIPVHPEDRDPSSSGKTGSIDGLSFLSSSEDELDGLEGEDVLLDSDEDTDRDIPANLDDYSPVQGFNGYDWKGMHDELSEFLGSDADDSEADSVASEPSQPSNKKRKRSRSSSPSELARQTSENGESSVSGDGKSGSRLAKRQQKARARTTGLKTVATASVNGSSLPSPDITGEELVDDSESEGDEPVEGEDNEDIEAVDVAKPGGSQQASTYDIGDDDDDDALERALEEEMGRASTTDEGDDRYEGDGGG